LAPEVMPLEVLVVVLPEELLPEEEVLPDDVFPDDDVLPLEEAVAPVARPPLELVWLLAPVEVAFVLDPAPPLPPPPTESCSSTLQAPPRTVAARAKVTRPRCIEESDRMSSPCAPRPPYGQDA
jgi:hypothetical protein